MKCDDRPISGIYRASVLIAIRPSLARDEYYTMLTRWGFEVMLAGSGIQCLAGLRESIPDVLIIEPELPWGGGDGVLAVVRDEPAWRDLAVLVLTWERNRSAMYHISQYPISDFAMQPVSAALLVERVARLAPRRRSEKLIRQA